MTFVLDLQILPAAEGADQLDAARGGPHLQSDLTSISCYGCSWLICE